MVSIDPAIALAKEVVVFLGRVPGYHGRELQRLDELRARHGQECREREA